MSRPSTSFDGYGVATSQIQLTTSATISVGKLRDSLAQGWGLSLDHFTPTDSGPADRVFTLILETLYRYDNGSAAGTVLSLMALVPTGSDQNSPNSFHYRSQCAAQNSSSLCGARQGCVWSAGSCRPQAGYQIPLFYADNIANGSAITQFGDDVASLCQSLVQKNGLVDFLWTVDNSGSMEPKIGQVVKSAALFFPFINNSEADYRIGMTTTGHSDELFPSIFPGCSNITSQYTCESDPYSGGCSWNSSTNSCVQKCSTYTSQGSCNPASTGCSWLSDAQACVWGGCSNITVGSACTAVNCRWTGSKCVLSSSVDVTDGRLGGDFTGAIAGQTDLSSVDRTTAYSCSEGCTITNCQAIGNQVSCAQNAACVWTGAACVTNCCPACVANGALTPNDPACYFAARLPNDSGSGLEYGLLMTEWAMYRAGAQPSCSGASSAGS
ncbi:MAG: hypothetical protein EOO40_03850, partial [Deltaproteobacteria bacterium]